MSHTSARLSLGFSCAGHTFSHLFMLLYPVVVLTLEREWGQPYESLLPLSFAGFVLFGAAALPAGWLGDRWSSSGMMAVFFLGTGASAIAAGLAQGPAQMAVALGAIGAFAAIYHPVGLAWLVRNAANRGKALGFNGVFGSLGTALAAAVAGALTDWISWRAAFLVPGAVAVVVGLVFVLLVRRGAVLDGTVDASPGRPPSRDDAVRVFLILFAAMMATGLIFQATSVSMPKVFALRMAELSGGTALGVGGLVTLVYLVSMGAHLLGGYLSDRFTMKRVYVGFYAAQVPLLLVAAYLDETLLLIAAIVMVFTNVASTVAENGLLAYFTPAKWRSTAYGAKFVLALGVGALGVPLVALIYDLTGGFAWLYLLLGIVAAVVSAVLLPLPAREDKAPAPAAAE